MECRIGREACRGGEITPVSAAVPMLPSAQRTGLHQERARALGSPRSSGSGRHTAALRIAGAFAAGLQIAGLLCRELAVI